MNLTIETIKNNFPFISVFSANDNENNIYGIVLNCDKTTVSIIDIEKIRNKDEIIKLLEIGENWWWYSNRDIPLNLFYYDECLPYMKYVSHLSSKYIDKIYGNESSLTNFTNSKKIFRKNKTLKVKDDSKK